MAIGKNELKQLKKLEASIAPEEVFKVYIREGDGFKDNDGKIWTEQELEQEQKSNSNIKQILVVPASEKDRQHNTSQS